MNAMGDSDKAAVRVSVVIEWENALHSEAERSSEMLRELKSQAFTQIQKECSGAFEILFVFDPTAFNEQELEGVLLQTIGPPDDTLSWALLPSAVSGYYKNKDTGARTACGEIILFLDSDVIPEPGWLSGLLSVLDDPAVQIVVGSTHIDPQGLLGKVFALTWFFPLRSSDGPVFQVSSFFANNLAMRKSLYLKYPFPMLPGSSRGSCILLASQLVDANIPVFKNPMARVTHPAPHGGVHFFKRGLVQGRDRVIRERETGSGYSESWLASCLRLPRHWARCLVDVLRNFRQIKMNPLLIPVVILVSWVYYLLYWSGEMLMHLGSRFVRNLRV